MGQANPRRTSISGDKETFITLEMLRKLLEKDSITEFRNFANNFISGEVLTLHVKDSKKNFLGRMLFEIHHQNQSVYRAVKKSILKTNWDRVELKLSMTHENTLVKIEIDEKLRTSIPEELTLEKYWQTATPGDMLFLKGKPGSNDLLAMVAAIPQSEEAIVSDKDSFVCKIGRVCNYEGLNIIEEVRMSSKLEGNVKKLSPRHFGFFYGETTRQAFLIKAIKIYLFLSLIFLVIVHNYDVDIYLSPVILDEAVASLLCKDEAKK